MSLWLQRKDANGGTHYFAVPCAPLAILAIVGILVALLLPAIQAVRAWLGG